MAGHGAEESCAKHGETWRCLRFTSMVKALPSIARTQRLDRNIKSELHRVSKEESTINFKTSGTQLRRYRMISNHWLTRVDKTFDAIMAGN
ncbi:uncharacterized protein LOC143213007 isoform X2 [Lasioglossum baleicum]|uniref:uncharacterized protein LOC143213007 isoform X2 n=1 Tax=Lasioglossum baleicum TaxID=434251 RepID=UPI003FCE7B98